MKHYVFIAVFFSVLLLYRCGTFSENNVKKDDPIKYSTNEEIIFKNSNHLLVLKEDVITNEQFRDRGIIDHERKFYVLYNRNIIIDSIVTKESFGRGGTGTRWLEGDKKPVVNIIKATEEILYYCIITELYDNVRTNHRERIYANNTVISKEYSKIYDIRYGVNDNIYYIGDIPNRTTRDFCRNSEVLGQNIQEYIISKDGLQYAFVKIGGVQIRGRDYLWHSSAIFLNGKEYYHSPLDRSIFINYHIFHPNGRSILYYYIDSTNENNSLYYFNINTNTYGPYAYIDKDSCIISDDQQYFIFKQKKNSIYDKWIEEKIVLK